MRGLLRPYPSRRSSYGRLIIEIPNGFAGKPSVGFIGGVFAFFSIIEAFLYLVLDAEFLDERVRTCVPLYVLSKAQLVRTGHRKDSRKKKKKEGP